MKRRFTLCATLSALTVVLTTITASAQQMPNFSGQWTLRYGTTGAGMCRSECTIRHDETGISFPRASNVTIHDLSETIEDVCGNLSEDHREPCREEQAHRRRSITQQPGWIGVWDGGILTLSYQPEPGSGERGESIQLSIGTFEGESGILTVHNAQWWQRYRR